MDNQNTLEQFKLNIIKDDDVYCVKFVNFPNILAQVDTLEEIPDIMGDMISAIIKVGFKENIHNLIDYQIGNISES